MIPTGRALVPLSVECRAAMQAVADVEKRRARGAGTGEFAYARAFFRILNGSKRVSLRDIRFFSPSMTEQELRGRRDNWLSAIDALIESRGTCCWLPLSLSDAWRLFPQAGFRNTERTRRQAELMSEKYSRQHRRAARQRDIAYQALAGQAETELAFQTPETVSHWYSRWSGTEVRQHDLEDMFWRWAEHRPSLVTLARLAEVTQPFWSVMYEVGQLAKESLPPVRALERWMVPNKLVFRRLHERA